MGRWYIMLIMIGAIGAELEPVEELGATAITLLCCTVRANLSPGFRLASALALAAAPRWDE